MRGDGKPPEIGVLAQGGIGETLAGGRNGDFDILSGARGDLLQRAAERTIPLDRRSPHVDASTAIRREINELAGGRPRRASVREKIVGDPGHLLGIEIHDANVELGAEQILEDDLLAIGRPGGRNVGDFLAGVGRDLLGIVTIAIERPDAPRADPGSVDRDAISCGREGRIEGFFDQLAFRAGGEIEHPDITVVELAEDVAGLQFDSRLARADEGNTLPVRRPGRLQIVGVAVGQLGILSGGEVLPKDFADLAHFAGIEQRLAIGRPGRILFDALGEGELRERCVKSGGRKRLPAHSQDDGKRDEGTRGQ